ncbi:UNVERIFIED_CONTAM: hypothetical protein RMT77_009197 [Armadillidium vulgare]
MFSRLLKCCIFSIHGIEHNIARPFSGISSCHQSIPKSIKIHPKIREAIVDKSPIVALESAIISHGMKYPFNFQTALEVESVVRSQGALPATIGLINGEIHVGLTEDQISFLSEYKTNCIKISRRDLSYAMAKKLHGGTTVSGTMIIAHMVGIPIFVTGGIGGVHRGGQNSMDVSADLTELGRTPVTVVSAGVKSILDVGRTLEYLETQGVCVASLGSSAAFPDFFSRDSGFKSPCHLESCEEAAQVMLQRKELGLNSGILIAVPIPHHQEAEGRIIKNAIDKALQEAESTVVGRDVTPFVLSKVAELTDGKSVITNIDLIKNNAKHGAQIAVEYSKMISSDKIHELSMKEDPGDSQPVVIGGSIIDRTVKILEKEVKVSNSIKTY